MPASAHQSPDWLFDCEPFPAGECGYLPRDPEYPEVTHRTFYSHAAHQAQAMERDKQAILAVRRQKRNELLRQRNAEDAARRREERRRLEAESRVRFENAEHARRVDEARHRREFGISRVVVGSEVFDANPDTGELFLGRDMVFALDCDHCGVRTYAPITDAALASDIRTHFYEMREQTVELVCGKCGETQHWRIDAAVPLSERPPQA